MKKINYINKLAVIILLFSGFFACDPMELDKPDAGFVPAPTTEQLSFTISQGDDQFHYVFENTSAVNGLVTWDLGNGITAKGDKVTGYYPLPGDYTVSITVSTNGGSGSNNQTLSTTETDYALFEDPLMIAISGGVDALDGKTWLLDSLANGHLGVGPADSYDPVWWKAGPLGKSGHFIYDDEFTFKLIGFEYIIDTKGATHANADGGAADKGLDLGFYTSVIWEDAFDKDVVTNDAARGALTWSLVTEGDKSFIAVSSYGGVIGYDGGNERKYEILSWDENTLYLRSVGGVARYHKLIRKGYERPKVEFDVNMEAGSETNEYKISHVVTNVPAGESITKVSVDFGDGTVVESEDVNEVLSNVYMRKGPYAITVTTTSTLGSEVNTFNVNIDANHPDYVEFLLDEIVMYVDFSEVNMAPVEGENCDVFVTSNPSKIYPNKSTNVAFYSKTNQEWANAFMKLPSGHRFDLRQQHVVKLKVYGKAGDVVLLKFENTDKGGDAWMTGTEVTYTIQKDNTWEVAEFDFLGVGVMPGSEGWKWWPEPVSYDVVNDDFYNHDFYNIIRIMLNPGVGEGTHEFYFDELAGPHVEGIKSATIK